MEFFISLIAFLILIGLVIFIHELGHFTAAKLSGVIVEEFALGFGPILWAKQFRGTHYMIRLFPLGGYVKLFGERDSEANLPGSFRAKPIHVKVFILLSGVFMNFALAVVLASIYLHAMDYRVGIMNITPYNFVGISDQSYTSGLFVTNITDTSPATGKLTKNEDLIIELNGKVFTTSSEFLSLLDQNQGKEITLTVLSVADLTTKRTETITLSVKEKPEDKLLGVGYRAFYILDYSHSVLSGVPHALNVFGYQVSALVSLISESFAQKEIGIVADQLASPVGVGVIVNDIVASGEYTELINLGIAINLGLAFFNILPIPALDGGQVFIEIIEKIRRKKFSTRTIEIMTTVGFVFLTGLGLLVILKDIVQFGVFDSIISAFKSVLGR